MADLQQSVTSVMLQKDKLSRENAQMSMLLDQKVNSGAAVPTWKPGFTLGEDSQTSFRYGDAIVLRKHSLAASSGRVAVTPVRSYQPTHAPTLDSTTIAKPEMSTSGDAEHAWDAVDFILALETPCRDHVNLPAHIAHQSDHAASEQGGPSNHAMTMTAAVYARTVSLGHCHPGTIDGHASTYGFVPHFEIERCIHDKLNHSPINLTLQIDYWVSAEHSK